MRRYDSPVYGPHMREAGYIAMLGHGEFNHRFGGTSWPVEQGSDDRDAPVALLVLDLADPRLGTLADASISELPLIGYINSDGSDGRFSYRLDAVVGRIVILHREIDELQLLPLDIRFDLPLGEKMVDLHPMESADLLTSIEAHARLCGELMGSARFIRVLGPPIWIEAVEEESCSLGHRMDYVGAVGHESYLKPSGYIDDRPFFLGEKALYFFLCKRCLEVTVLPQGS